MSDRNKFIAGLLILLVTIGYGVFQWYEREALAVQATVLSTEAANLTAVSDNLREDYDAIKVEVSAARETAEQELSVVFPTKEDLTTLTRFFDDFSVKNNFASNPFFISSLSYDAAVAPEGTSYRVVPLRLSIETSKKNLSKFLETIETSGSLEGEVRLMSVEDIKIQYPDEFGGSYEVQVEIFAYFSQEI
ncbi:MAG: hypothetical protein AAB383_04680 [Patescibacteria group bacterium]